MTQIHKHVVYSGITYTPPTKPETAPSILDGWKTQDQDPDDKALKNTINELFVAPANGVIPEVAITGVDNKPSTEKKPEFILKTRGYYDVKLYVIAGMLFPDSAEKFAQTYSKDAMKNLNAIDSGIYDETCNTMVAIHKSCENFNKESMANWFLVANQTIQYCEYAIQLLSGFGESSLGAQLKIVLDNKYSTPESQNDPDFQNAALVCNAILLELSMNAKEKAAVVDQQVKKLEAFLNETETNATNIGFLRQQYHDGPVTVGKTKTPKMGSDGKTPQQPYAFFLQKELEDLRKEISRAVDQYNKDFDDWKYNTTVAATAATYIWIPIAGWIAGGTTMGMFTARAVTAHDDYEKHKKYAQDKQKEEAPLAKLLEDVRMLVSQQESIAAKMQAAIGALKEIRSLFLSQSKNYGLAASMMGLANAKVNTSLFMRKAFLQNSVNAAVKNWQKVADLAQEFLDTADDVKRTGITPSVTPPSG